MNIDLHNFRHENYFLKTQVMEWKQKGAIPKKEFEQFLVSLAKVIVSWSAILIELMGEPSFMKEIQERLAQLVIVVATIDPLDKRGVVNKSRQILKVLQEIDRYCRGPKEVMALEGPLNEEENSGY